MHHSTDTAVPNFEHRELRQRLNTLREENDKLYSQNHKLINQMESMSFQVQQLNKEVLEQKNEIKSSQDTINSMKNKTQNLESDVEAQDSELRHAESKFNECQQIIHDLEGEIEQYRDKINYLNDEAEDNNKICMNFENERDSAIRAIKELEKSLKECQNYVKEKNEEVKMKENNFNHSLMKSKSELSDLCKKNSSLVDQIDELQRLSRRCKEDQLIEHELLENLEKSNMKLNSQIKDYEMKLAQFEDKSKSRLKLEQDNTHMTTHIKSLTDQLNSKLKLMNDLQETIRCLNCSIQDLQKDNKTLKLQIDNDSGVGISNTVSLASIGPSLNSIVDAHWYNPGSDETFCSETQYNDGFKKKNSNVGKDNTSHPPPYTIKAEIPPLSKFQDISPCNDLQQTLESVKERFKITEQELLVQVEKCKEMEDSQCKLISQIKFLEDKFQDVEVSNNSYKSRLSQRQSQLEELQTELEETNACNSKFRAEIKKKNSQLEFLENQLNETTSNVSQKMLKIAQLEEEISMLSSNLQKVSNELDETSRKYMQTDAMVEKMKQLHLEQCHELEKNVELLERKLDRKTDQMAEFENQNNILQQEIQLKEAAYQDARRELEMYSKQNQSINHKLETDLLESEAKVKHLEATLQISKQEVQHNLIAIDSLNDQHTSYINIKDVEVLSLKKEINEAVNLTMEKENQIQEWESILKDKEQIISENSYKIDSLEECQTQLECTVSRLEQMLEREKKNWADILSEQEKQLQKTSNELDRREHQVEDMIVQIKDLVTEKNGIDYENISLEKKIKKMKKEIECKIDEMHNNSIKLKNCESELKEKNELVEDFQEQIQTHEYDAKEAQEQIRHLQSALKETQKNLHNTKRNMITLEDEFDFVKNETMKKEEIIESLKASLSCSQEELNSRNREIEELIQVLKQRQIELDKRILQLAELDVHVQESQNELTQQIKSLQECCQLTQTSSEEKDKKVKDLQQRIIDLQNNLDEKSKKLEDCESDYKSSKIEVYSCSSKIEQLEMLLEKMQIKEQTSQIEYERLVDKCQESNGFQKKFTSEITELKYLHEEATKDKEMYLKQLKDFRESSQEKEITSNKLAQDVEEMKEHEFHLESKFKSEILKLQKEVDTNSLQHSQKISEIEIASQKVLSIKEDQLKQTQSWLKASRVREENFINEIENFKSKIIFLEAAHKVKENKLPTCEMSQSIEKDECGLIDSQGSTNSFESIGNTISSPDIQSSRKSSFPDSMTLSGNVMQNRVNLISFSSPDTYKNFCNSSSNSSSVSIDIDKHALDISATDRQKIKENIDSSLETSQDISKTDEEILQEAESIIRNLQPSSINSECIDSHSNDFSDDESSKQISENKDKYLKDSEEAKSLIMTWNKLKTSDCNSTNSEHYNRLNCNNYGQSLSKETKKKSTSKLEGIKNKNNKINKTVITNKNNSNMKGDNKLLKQNISTQVSNSKISKPLVMQKKKISSLLNDNPRKLLNTKRDIPIKNVPSIRKSTSQKYESPENFVSNKSIQSQYELMFGNNKDKEVLDENSFLKDLKDVKGVEGINNFGEQLLSKLSAISKKNITLNTPTNCSSIDGSDHC